MMIGYFLVDKFQYVQKGLVGLLAHGVPIHVTLSGEQFLFDSVAKA